VTEPMVLRRLRQSWGCRMSPSSVSSGQQVTPCTINQRLVVISCHAWPLAGVGLLLANYIGAIILAFLGGFNTPVMAGFHGILASLLVYRTWKLHVAR
jgi:hypothetical protein